MTGFRPPFGPDSTVEENQVLAPRPSRIFLDPWIASELASRHRVPEEAGKCALLSPTEPLKGGASVHRGHGRHGSRRVRGGA